MQDHANHSEDSSSSHGREDTPKINTIFEWRRAFTGITMALLLFETITGLAIFFMPFSVFNQLGVLWHTLIGVAMLLPVAWYLAEHWWRRFRGRFNHYRLLGYLSAAALLAILASGCVLTFQSLFGIRITTGWDLIHLVATFALVFVLVTHMSIHWFKKQGSEEARTAFGHAKKVFLGWCLGGTALLLVIHVISAGMYREAPVHNEFPEDYSWKYGKDRPFAPSLVRTATNWAYDPSTLADSTGCGRTGCHYDILREWEPSAHRYASSDAAFQAVQRIMLEDTGPESTRYCAGCHDPIALFSGSKNVNVEGLTSVGADDGVSCIVCHSITQTDIRGNADYTITQPVRYVGEGHEGGLSEWISDFLIRAYPGQHKADYTKPLYKTAEYCAACHKQFIDEEVNQIGWVQLQNQYDNWRKSRWYHEGDPKKTVTCRECHMPLLSSTDPAAGDEGDYNRSTSDGKHRSHRFLAANQVMPLLMKLPGAEEHVKLTEAWLRGEIEVPEIADKWTSGPVIRIDLTAPEQVKPGEDVQVRVVLTNNKTGHGFPTGPLDIIRSWVEIKVTDDRGNLVYEIGRPDEKGFMDEEAMVFKADGIDRYGNDIDRHNLWEMVGARFKRAIFPGMSDSEIFSFTCPGFSAPAVEDKDSEEKGHTFRAPPEVKELHVNAIVNYQKADAAFLDRLFGSEAGIRTPVTMLGKDSLTIRVEQ